MNKIIGIILIIAIILLGAAAIVTHHFGVWPWTVSTDPVVTVVEPAVEPVPSVEEIPVPEEVTIKPIPALADEPVIIG